MFGSNEKDKMQKTKKNNIYNTETMLPISEIRGDTMLLKDKWLRAVIKVTGLNIELRNYDEQVIVVEQYKRFLNGLDFPVQILIRNNYLELSDYITYMQEHVNHIEHPALKEQGDAYVKFLDEINNKQWLIFVKEFYIVVPYYPGEADKDQVRKPWRKLFLDAFSRIETPEKIVERYRSFLKHDKFLDTRVNVIMEGLRGIGVYSERLTLTDLISLLFKVYNPESHKDQAVYTGGNL